MMARAHVSAQVYQNRKQGRIAVLIVIVNRIPYQTLLKITLHRLQMARVVLTHIRSQPV